MMPADDILAVIDGRSEGCVVEADALELDGFRVDTIITDPPYHLTQASRKGSARIGGTGPFGRHKMGRRGFMGKTWDGGGIAFDPAVWRVCLGVAKPGAMLLAFGGTRTFHRLACAIEDAGWEIRDTIMWVYGSGFPKSLDIGKAIDKAAGAEREVTGTRRISPTRPQHGVFNDDNYEWQEDVPVTAPATEAAKLWDGWGTALKPAWEPIVVAMKPLDGTFAHNALTHGVAGLNIDGGRIEHIEACRMLPDQHGNGPGNFYAQGGRHKPTLELKPAGRWPANIIHDGSEDVVGVFPETASGALRPRHVDRGKEPGTYGEYAGREITQNFGDDSGSAARFFYCAKASRAERGRGNTHPTVKPLALMEYLCTLTLTPTGGVVLDPFCGSGSTLVAARRLGRPYIGVDIDPESVATAMDRLRDTPRPLFGRGEL